jgi:hypothetical protein
VTAQATQPPKRGRTRRRARLWLNASADEKKAVRKVTQAEGLAKGEALRRYSLNQIVEKARLLDGNQA